MFKIGDCVKFKKTEMYHSWSTHDSYVIIGYYPSDNNILLLDKPLIVEGFEDNTIHESFIEIDLNYTRIKKLESLFNE